MDRITSSLLKEFVITNGLESLAEDRAFEHFTGYLIISSHYSETFSSDEIADGAGGTVVLTAFQSSSTAALLLNLKKYKTLPRRYIASVKQTHVVSNGRAGSRCAAVTQAV